MVECAVDVRLEGATRMPRSRAWVGGWSGGVESTRLRCVPSARLKAVRDWQWHCWFGSIRKGGPLRRQYKEEQGGWSSAFVGLEGEGGREQAATGEGTDHAGGGTEGDGRREGGGEQHSGGRRRGKQGRRGKGRSEAPPSSPDREQAVLVCVARCSSLSRRVEWRMVRAHSMPLRAFVQPVRKHENETMRTHGTATAKEGQEIQRYYQAHKELYYLVMRVSRHFDCYFVSYCTVHAPKQRRPERAKGLSAFAPSHQMVCDISSRYCTSFERCQGPRLVFVLAVSLDEVAAEGDLSSLQALNLRGAPSGRGSDR
jgi:hypothetical protein